MNDLAAPPVTKEALQRAVIRVQGRVQGVGFRPFVYRQARALGLCGSVCNDGAGVLIEAEAPPEALAAFITRLQTECPPLSSVSAVDVEWRRAVGLPSFAVGESGKGEEITTAVVPDAAVCDCCLEELFNPLNRRYRYPFINCTDCGPRYTITHGLPYDRPQTSMAAFKQCPACAAEYRDPGYRRFHAQPNACPECGPAAWMETPRGERLSGDAIALALEALHEGKIVALRGLGGFQLLVDARQPEAVARLRDRKSREAKPFAVMAVSPEGFDDLAVVDEKSASLLSSSPRPIVLLPKRVACDEVLQGVAPDVAELGVMLPSAPLHWLLFHEAAGRPTGREWSTGLLLVCTSANPQGEPLVIHNNEATERLDGIADLMLTHDRPIVARCDDSVVRTSPAGRPVFVRRARGYTPLAVPLACDGPVTLALGGHLKNTVCVTRGNEAFLSPHIGDLDNAATCRALDEAVSHLCRILAVRPERVAHDLHPDFYSTRFAAGFASRNGLPRLAVQHHRAHAAAVLAEHKQREPALALALDGVGLGEDGTVWGGELLRVEGLRCQRLGHFSPLPLPGGDRAAREPWRMAAAVLWTLGQGEDIPQRFRQPAAEMLPHMLSRRFNCPPATSAGRYFDAAAGLLGIHTVAAFEGQAAMALEALAHRHPPVAALDNGWIIAESGELDLAPLWKALAACEDAGRGAALFHATLAAALTDWVLVASRRTQLKTVALGGGCFLNRWLSEALACALCEAGLTVLEARLVPPNDGGLSLGQAWVAQQATSDSLFKESSCV